MTCAVRTATVEQNSQHRGNGGLSSGLALRLVVCGARSVDVVRAGRVCAIQAARPGQSE
jgi:hypothetical protein